MNDLIRDVEAASGLAQTIVDTVRDPLLVLDRNLLVAAASQSFYVTFGLDSAAVLGQSIYDLIDGQFKVAALRSSLDGLVSSGTIIDGLEVGLTVPVIGRRIFVLNARRVFGGGVEPMNFLLVFEDITHRRRIERENKELLERTGALLNEKDILLQELQHRVFNSLQIIASILLMKAESASGETRLHLKEAHERLIAVGKVQRLIQTAGRGGLIELGPYLKNLCDSLANSMVDPDEPVAVEVAADDSAIDSANAVSVGLIVTELVINALKHAFPKGYPNSKVIIHYESTGSDWQLVVSDNGVGRSADPVRKDGLGIALVDALARQLDARLGVVSTANGMTVSVTHSAVPPESPRVA